MPAMAASRLAAAAGEAEREWRMALTIQEGASPHNQNPRRNKKC
jgi:hypothetical protein